MLQMNAGHETNLNSKSRFEREWSGVAMCAGLRYVHSLNYHVAYVGDEEASSLVVKVVIWRAECQTPNSLRWASRDIRYDQRLFGSTTNIASCKHVCGRWRHCQRRRLAVLFTTCVKCFDVIIAGKNLCQDYEQLLSWWVSSSVGYLPS